MTFGCVPYSTTGVNTYLLNSLETIEAIRYVLVSTSSWVDPNGCEQYSKKSLLLSPNSSKFWDFSLDDLCMKDIPSSLEYILDLTKPPSGKLSYIGFSQGSAQAFAALSVNPPLNEKIEVFIALAPAFSPKGELLASPHISQADGHVCRSCGGTGRRANEILPYNHVPVLWSESHPSIHCHVAVHSM